MPFEHLTQQILQLHNIEFWAWAGFAVLVAASAFYFAFRSLKRARIIEDTPTARIRSAHQGYVELTGTAESMNGEPIVAPLTESHCCWYRYRIEKRHDKNWRTLEKGSSDGLFLIQDDTGRCIIDPDGAEVTPTDRSVWYGNSRHPTDRKPSRQRPGGGSLSVLGFSLNVSVNTGTFNRYRYTEERIYPGDPLYAIGFFKSQDELDHHKARVEITRDILRDWKRDQTGLLGRFDRNGDGRIDAEEWERARQAAGAEARETHTEQIKNQVLHTLGKTGNRRYPFLLSSIPQFTLVKRYRLIAGFSLGGFFMAGGFSVWLMGARFLS